MGRRNIYLPDARQGLYDEAALMAGSLSGAIDQALEVYVRQVRAGWLATEVHELPVGRPADRSGRRLSVRARRLGAYPVPSTRAGRHEGVQVFQGLSGRLAAWRFSDPDWSKVRELSRWQEEGEEPDWFERWGVSFTVAESLDELLAPLPLDPQDVDELRRAVMPRVVEVVDL